MRLFVLVVLLLAGGAAADGLPEGPFSQAQCSECHAEKSPAVHSYATSKHGVLARLGNGPVGRSPDCVGCHTERAHAPSNPERMRQNCNRCHSSRYVRTLITNGKQMIELGMMKAREAEQLLLRARAEFPADSLLEMEAYYLELQQHLTNLRLGVAHQSPDYQWWHGQPALDGDLLHIKGAYDLLQRQRALE